MIRPFDELEKVIRKAYKTNPEVYEEFRLVLCVEPEKSSLYVCNDLCSLFKKQSEVNGID